MCICRMGQYRLSECHVLNMWVNLVGETEIFLLFGWSTWFEGQLVSFQGATKRVSVPWTGWCLRQAVVMLGTA